MKVVSFCPSISHCKDIHTGGPRRNKNLGNTMSMSWSISSEEGQESIAAFSISSTSPHRQMIGTY